MKRIVFAGTPDFARESLQALIDADMAPVAVLTQPDRPAGRGKKLTASPVKLLATQYRLPVLQPQTLKDAETAATLRALDADVFIVAAYGLLLPQQILDIPRCGCINVHASLLPRWRGAAPIQAAILAGDNRSGISLMQMEAGLDTGPVFATAEISLAADETAGELHDRLAKLGGERLVQHLPAILDGKLQAIAQDDSVSTYAPKFRSADARLDWSSTAAGLQRLVRAYNPVPGAWFEFNGERLKCFRAIALEGAAVDAQAGCVVTADGAGIDVVCGDGVLRMTELQRPGRGRCNAGELAQQLDFGSAVLA